MDAEREQRSAAAEAPQPQGAPPARSTRSGGASTGVTHSPSTGPAPVVARFTEGGPSKIRRGVGDVAPAALPNKTGLPDALKSGIESLSGFALDEVRVHRNSALPAQMGALAYTRGTDIHLGPGHEQELAHEAWHVVQQAQGRVKPTTQVGGVAVNDQTGLEAEADAMGAKAASGGGPEPEASPSPLPDLSGDVAQMRKFGEGEAMTWLVAKIKGLDPLPDEVAFHEMSAWLKADAGLNADYQANLDALKPIRAAALATVVREASLDGLTKQRDVDATMRQHVLRGEIKGKAVTGGHWREGCEANGLIVTAGVPDADGFYKGTVKTETGPAKASSFYPDDWSEQDVIDAMEYATQPIKKNPILVIETPKGQGTELFQNNDSIFPNLD